MCVGGKRTPKGMWLASMMSKLSILSGLLLIKYTLFLPKFGSFAPLVVLSTLMIAWPEFLSTNASDDPFCLPI